MWFSLDLLYRCRCKRRKLDGAACGSVVPSVVAVDEGMLAEATTHKTSPESRDALYKSWGLPGCAAGSVGEAVISILTSRDAVHAATTLLHGPELDCGTPVRSLSYDPKAEAMLAGCEDRKVRVLNAAAGTVERVVDCGSDVNSLSYDPKAEATLAGCDDGKVRVKAA